VATSRHAEPVTQHGGVLEPLARLVDAAREDTSQTKSRPKAASQFNPDDGSGGHQSFVLDGEAVLLDAEGISDFNAPHSRKRDAEVQLYAFDILAADGEDLRRRSRCARSTWRGSWPVASTASTWRRSSKARSARTCSPPYAAWAGGPGLQAPPSAVPRRPLRWVDQGQEPEASGVQAGDGYVRVRGGLHG
jgi:hypothetical protein